jgi:2-amino-4-hydroxy-6-hydroxymethyldihydropteridine diphosphokinase
MSLETVTAYVSLGSNIGDRAGNLLLAVRGLLEAHLCVKRLSAIYQTEPFEVESHENYFNMVAEIQVSNLSPDQMLARMLRIEYLLGRRRSGSAKAPRTVDLDLILFGNLQRNNMLVKLPHPQMHLRNFVLVPLAEIAPNLTHPVFKKTIRELLKATTDKSQVQRWQPKSIDQVEIQET